MNIPPGTPPRNEADTWQEDKRDLRDALLKLRLVLDNVINEPDPLVSQQLAESLRADWPKIENAIDNLDGIIAGDSYVNDFKAVGLTGTSLRPKIGGFRRAWHRLFRGGVAAFRRNARWLFGWANTILGSIAVIPVAKEFAELTKEFKECVEHDLEEDESQPSGDVTKSP